MKKPDLKINFLYYGVPFDIKKDFFVNFLKKKYNIIISKKPDYVFFSVYKENNKFLSIGGTVKNLEKSIKKEKFLIRIIRRLRRKKLIEGVIWFLREKNLLKPYARILKVKGDFVKIFYNLESIKPDMSKCDWAFGLLPESEINHPRYMRIPPYILFSNNSSLKDGRRSFARIKKEKTKFCNFVYNSHVPPRNRFFKKLNKYKHVDSPGKCMNNMPPIGTYKNTDESRGSVNWEKEKLDFMKPYKFTIAFENTSRNGFNTDRTIHSFLVNSIPIFMGDKTIKRDLNTQSFVNCNEFRNFDEVIKRIIEIDKNDEIYRKMLSQPWYKNNNPSRQMKKKLEKRFDKIFEMNIN